MAENRFRSRRLARDAAAKKMDSTPPPNRTKNFFQKAKGFFTDLVKPLERKRKNRIDKDIDFATGADRGGRRARRKSK